MQYLCIFLFILVLHHTFAANAIDADIAPTTYCSSDSATKRNTTCTIYCNTPNQGGISKKIDCGKITTCIIHCSARMCLSNSQIDARDVSSLQIISTASYCITNTDIYLPNGDITIKAYNAPYAFSSNTLYTQSSTNSISIQCTGNRNSDPNVLCNDLFLDASSAQTVHLTVTKTSANGAYIVCPTGRNTECIINATDAISLQNATVIAHQRVIMYMGKKTDITNSIYECDDDAVMQYEFRDTYYYGFCLPSISSTELASTSAQTDVYITDSSDSIDYILTSANRNSSSDMVHVDPYEILVGKVHNTGYLMMILLIGTPVLLVTVAAIYNVRFKGSDTPNFSSILKCFMNTADFYIDIIFCVLLLFKLSILLFICCVACISISHIISNCMVWYYIHKWEKKKILYIKQYKLLLITLSLIVGFYAAIQLLSSKLFYLMPFSMQLSHSQAYRIQILTICNDVLFRNIPVISIAILSVLEPNRMKMDIITTIALVSSLFMLITGSLTLLSRCISTNCRFKYNFAEDNILIDVILTSDTIRNHHQFCHRLFAEAVALSLGIASDRVETLCITQVAPEGDGARGICCNVEILLIDDRDKVYRHIDDIQNDWDSAMYNFKIALCKSLYIIEMDVDVIITRDSRDSQSTEHEYKALPQKRYKEIEIVKVSTSLNTDQLSEIHSTDDRKYNDDNDDTSTESPS